MLQKAKEFLQKLIRIFLSLSVICLVWEALIYPVIEIYVVNYVDFDVVLLFALGIDFKRLGNFLVNIITFTFFPFQFLIFLLIAQVFLLVLGLNLIIDRFDFLTESGLH